MARALRPRKGKQTMLSCYHFPRTTPGHPTLLSSKTLTVAATLLQKKAVKALPTMTTRSSRNELAMDEDIVEPEVKSIDTKGKESEVEKKKSAIKAVSVGPASSARRQMHTLPTPSVHHRHRATPLFQQQGRVQRLTRPPVLFGSPQVVLTNNFTHSGQISDRLAEDRRWFKESPLSGDGFEEEAKRRPRVYLGLPVMAGWGILDVKSVFGVWFDAQTTEAMLRDGTAYLPTANEANEDGSLKPAPPVPCHFGSVESQVRRDVRALEAFSCPDRSNSTLPSPPSRTVLTPRNRCQGAAAITSVHTDMVSKPLQGRPERSGRAQKDFGQMTCEMILCIDSGPAFDLKWCPLPSHDPKQADRKLKKLGLLGGTFEDGSFCVYVVPDPEDITTREEGPCLIRIDPLLRVELPEAACWSFDWANSQRVAIGTTNGAIVVYDIGRDLSTWNDPIRSTGAGMDSSTTFLCVRGTEPTRRPTVIASGGYDGVECLTDVREGRGSIMNRTRDVINTLTFSPFAAGPITMDHENTVKSYAASPSMLGRGHTLLEPLALFGIYMLPSTTLSLLLQPLMERAPPRIPCVASTRWDSPLLRAQDLPDGLQPEREPIQDARLLPPRGITYPPSIVKNTKKNDAPLPQNTGAWSKNVSIHRVRWNNGNGPAASCLLASATASGLCRVDVLWGRWIKDKMPYGGIEQIRMENGDAWTWTAICQTWNRLRMRHDPVGNPGGYMPSKPAVRDKSTTMLAPHHE
ncbi:hypothetical protein BKA70DRAFT_1520930 [Coprinopsis sp. MPI-PUGE-AT-0042]|nr:hypothetical protein BKA70DRAFT_1520930 [Coprinopsis sp. MPI-PUGE-AT-0042]